jgi:uncharacterized membrane protein YhiD involved in acid resistance
MISIFRWACAASLLVLVLVPSLVGRAQTPTLPVAAPAAALPAPANTLAPGSEEKAADQDEQAPGRKKASKSLFSEDGPVDTAWGAQLDALWRAVVRLPTAALLSAVLAFRPRRLGTPERQAPVIQTQIILAIVGAMVMLVVGASLARAFGIVGAAGLIRYRAKIADPKDAGVMLSTLAIGLASGVGLYLFAVFATLFVLGVLWTIESIDAQPYLLFDLAITAKDSAGMKDQIEGVLLERRIPFDLRSTSEKEICYEVKLPLDTHTEAVSDALMGLKPPQEVNVKWEQKKDAKP